MLIPIVPTGKDPEARLVGIPMLCDVSIHRYLYVVSPASAAASNKVFASLELRFKT